MVFVLNIFSIYSSVASCGKWNKWNSNDKEGRRTINKRNLWKKKLRHKDDIAYIGSLRRVYWLPHAYRRTLTHTLNHTHKFQIQIAQLHVKPACLPHGLARKMFLVDENRSAFECVRCTALVWTVWTYVCATILYFSFDAVWTVERVRDAQNIHGFGLNCYVCLRFTKCFITLKISQ